jgi:hypothetical protein
MDGSTEPTGVLVIRVWLEQRGLRARISSSLDIERGEEVVTVVGSIEEIQATVTEWLRRFAAPTGRATRL